MIQQFKNKTHVKMENCMDNSEQYRNNYFPYHFEELETDITMLSSNSCKVFSKKYNKTMILKRVVFFQKYTLEDFINDLKQYKKLDLHENILKFIAIIKQSINEIIFVHEYAFNGTLCQYLNQNFNKINWNDNEIVDGKREIVVPGTPKNYIKIYTECWQHNSNQRPTIQLCNKNENKDQPMSEIRNSNSTKLLNYYTDLHDKTAKELMLISSIINILSENSMVNDRNNSLNLISSLSTLNIVKTIPISLVNASKQNNIDYQFLYDLNQLFITQFNVQGSVIPSSVSSVIYCLKNHMVEHNKNSKDILEHYNNYKFKYYFTSIIGFFYEHGIGTIVDYYKAFDMYKQAAENFNSSIKMSNLLKENQIIGLISLGLCYIDGKGIIEDQLKALYLFLKSVAKGSSSGKSYIGQCYDYDY
ncbi:2880_t:CDS:2, partial [Cetraspora pellucida]